MKCKFEMCSVFYKSRHEILKCVLHLEVDEKYDIKIYTRYSLVVEWLKINEGGIMTYFSGHKGVCIIIRNAPLHYNVMTHCCIVLRF